METSITITKDAYKELIAICHRLLPNEACGILISEPDAPESSEMLVSSVRSIHNNHADPKHAYSFDPMEWIDAYFTAQKNRQSIIGFFHSHPSTPPIPSEYDVSGFWSGDSSFTYWIISLSSPDHPVIQPYCQISSVFHPLTLIIA